MSKIELKIKETQKKFENIFLNSLIAIEIYDSNGKLISVNKTCLELFGVPSLSYVKGFDLFNDPNIPKKELKKLKSGNSIRYEAAFDFEKVKKLKLYKTLKSGIMYLDVLITPIYFEKGENVNNYLVQIQDITERKKSELIMKSSEEKFRELFNHMSSGVAVYEAIKNGIDFIFKEFNLAGEKIDNIKKSEIIGKSVLEVFPGVKKFGLFDVFQRVWKTGKPEYHPITLYEDDRIKGWRENYVYKLSSGEIVAVYDDITEKMITLQKLKESEKHLKKLNEELKHKIEQRMKELRESENKYRRAYEKANFYRDLFAHDIKNILTVMNTSADLFSYYLDGSVKSEDIITVKNNIKKQVQRGVKLISNVHKLTELEEIPQSTKKIEIIHFLKFAINYVKKTYQDKNIKIKIAPPEKVYYAIANEFLQDIFENIIINGIMYNENSEIEINIKISQIKRDDKNFIKIEFIDNGIGIADERKVSIFKRSSEFKGTKGMGLGLSLVKKIVEIFNGMIWVEDKVKGDYSKGSKFILLLPQVDSS
ncbi:MAG: ATP-binding protein [Promethearchaeota archaeon]